MSGWLPIFDTINGVRGEVNVQVKVELFSDHNKFRQSSCGVQFFCSKRTYKNVFCTSLNCYSTHFNNNTYQTGF